MSPKRQTVKPSTQTEEEEKLMAPAVSIEELHSSRSLASNLKNQVKDIPPHKIVIARAGTGKTTTLVEGMTSMRGLPVMIEPSPQQAAVWDVMRQSNNASSIRFTCFNKPIAVTLQEKILQRGLDKHGCEAGTMHSFGYKAVQQVFGRQQPNGFVISDYIREILGCDIRELRKQPSKIVMVKAVDDLVSLCKSNLLEPTEENLNHLADYYDVDLGACRTEIFDLVPKIIEKCKDPKGRISFDDMIWLPVALDLGVQRFDLMLVDEAQDLNRCQQALAKKAASRLILVGDPKQAIYGFAGADAESMPRMLKELSATDTKCDTLPLTVTYRCSQAVVREAQKYVEDFTAHENNPDGLISSAKMPKKYSPTDTSDYRNMAKSGDMVLCRCNAPLVSECFKFLKSNRKATIQGRDVGGGLVRLINKLDAKSVPDLVGRLSDWFHLECEKENAKRSPNAQRLAGFQDKYDCLQMFTKDQTNVPGVVAKIESVFSDQKDAAGIKLSSVHKAKGLEAHRVFLLQPKEAKMPHPLAKVAWQREQEFNLLYVGITRAINELTHVSE